MIIHGMTIRLYLTNTARTDIIFRSPAGKKSSGWRMKLGWSVLKIGAKIMFGKEWKCE